MTEPNKRLTLDDIDAELSKIARHGEGADKFRALKMLKAEESSTVTLPDPLTDMEIVERLARLNKAAGPIAAQLAYRRAFPAAKKPVNAKAPSLTFTDVEGKLQQLPTSLSGLYKRFPALRRPRGFPKGYPAKGTLEERTLWCQKTAREIILDHEQKAIDEISKEASIPEPTDAP